MKVERLLQLSIALLAALGSMLLAIGQRGESTLPLLATAAAFGSVYLTDIRGWIMLNRNLANFAALVAVLFSFFDFWGDASSTMKLHAIAKLLIYLQVVLLFQPKTVRVYWHLAVLSLLQVVVAAALNMSVTFGLMLIPYMFTALTALSLFFVYRETLRVDSELRAAHDAVENRPLFAFLRLGQPAAEVAPPTAPPISLTGQLPANLAHVFSIRKMISQILKMGVFTLLVTVVLFYSVPRLERGQLPSNLGGLGATTGFKDQISLNDMGRILQSDQFVMRVRLTDARTGDLVESDYEPYFRGTSLSTYFPQSRTWIVGSLPHHRVRELQAPPQQQNLNLVRQTIATNQSMRFDNTSDGVLLFSMYPAYRSANTSPEIVDNQTLGIVSLANPEQTHIRQPPQYEVLVHWQPFGLRGSLTPVQHPRRDRRFRHYLESELKRVPLEQDIANTLFSGLERTAAELVSEMPADATPLEIAQRLERHFVLDGNYTYSLHIPIHLKDTSLDPIEDFVVNHRTGHCEYYASALTIMLRSQGIPARVVVGYKGGEFNSVGGYYAVKQKHAHAWVEAYFHRDQLPETVDAAEFPQGAWLRLDPTPASRPATSRKESDTLVGTLLDWFDYVELAWRDYVVDMNSERQERGIYRPLTDNLVKPFEGWVSQARWAQFFRNQLASMGIHLSDQWFNGFASMFTMLVLLVVVVLLELSRAAFRRWWPRLRRVLARWLPTSGKKASFYFTAEQYLAKAGWQRRPSDTPREFVDRVIADCQTRQVGQSMVPALTQLTDWYYQVRYGGHDLAPTQQQTVADHLTTIQQQALTLRHTRPS